MPRALETDMPKRPGSNLAEWAVFLAPAIALAVVLALMALLAG